MGRIFLCKCYGVGCVNFSVNFLASNKFWGIFLMLDKVLGCIFQKK